MRDKLVKYFEDSHKKPTLLIDLMNMLIRHTAVNLHKINGAGNCIGGAEGTIQEILALIRKFRPKSVFVVQDAGHLRKSILLSNYKKNRKLQLKCKASEEILEVDETRAMLNYQVSILSSLFPTLKIHYVYVTDTEADDVLAILSQVIKPSIIVSCDSDFIQLHNFTDTFVYNPKKKKILEDKDIKSHGAEFAVIRAIIGDKSDNIRGIGQIGWKRILTWKGETIIENLETLLKIASERNDKLGKKILANYDTIAKNYEVICLKPEFTHNQEMQKVLLEVLSQPAKTDFSEAIRIFKKEGLSLNLVMDNAMVFNTLEA